MIFIDGRMRFFGIMPANALLVKSRFILSKMFVNTDKVQMVNKVKVDQKQDNVRCSTSRLMMTLLLNAWRVMTNKSQS